MEDSVATGTAAPEDHGGKQPNYMAVFFGLAALTIIEVIFAMMGFDRTLTILVLVGLAIWKAVLVALYYMHLKFEPVRLVLMVVAPLPLAFILVLAVLTEF